MSSESVEDRRKEFLKERTKDFFIRGDKELLKAEKEHNKYLVLKENISYREKNNLNNSLGSKIGLVCEYYLKGMLLNFLNLDADNNENLGQDYDNKIHAFVSVLTDEDRFAFLASGVNSDDLAMKYGIWDKTNNTISNKAKNFLTNQTIKKIGGNGHDLSKLIEVLPQDIKDTLYKLIIKGINGLQTRMVVNA